MATHEGNGEQPIMERRLMRIAVLHFSHETVTFLKNDTTLADFTYPGSPAKGEALLKYDPKNYMGGFVKMAREFDGVELVGIESPLWPRTGTGSGWITHEAWETFVGKMIGRTRHADQYTAAARDSTNRTRSISSASANSAR